MAGARSPEPGGPPLPAPAASGRGPGPSLAVVVPTWNEEACLARLLESLEAPSGVEPAVPDEVVVADGGSTDATLRVARERGARVVRVARGRGGQLAAGARAARAEVLWFLHADVVVEPGAVAALRAAFREPDVFACGVRQRIEASQPVYRLIERVADLRVSLGRVYGDSGLAVRRGAYEAVGGFRDLPLFEDLDLSRRLRRRGRIRLVRDAVTRVSPRRWQAEGPLRRTVRNWALTLAWTLGVDPVRLARYYPPHSGAAGEP